MRIAGKMSVLMCSNKITIKLPCNEIICANIQINKETECGVIAIVEMIDNFSENYIVIYCILILWINLDYLRDHKNIQKGLDELPSDEELLINPSSISLILIRLIFEFIRRWIIYLLAFFITENLFVLLIVVILFIASLYDAVFNYSLAKVKQTKIGLYLAIADILFIVIFITYLFVR